MASKLPGKSDEPAIKGRTLAYPVAADWKPDLRGNLHDISEYLEEQGGYDLFDYLLKDLMIKQPADPLQHMLDCLEKGYPTGPLKVFVSSPPGLGRERFARSLAERLGLRYVGAGELLREAGVDTTKGCYADDEQVSKLVLELIRQAEQKLEGVVVDGFPRTPCQTAFLKEKAIVPTHVLLLQASEDFLLQRQQRLADGSLEGRAVPAQILDPRIKMHTAQNALALELYSDRTIAIDAEATDEEVLARMEQGARLQPRSKAPSPSPRVGITGPRGSGAPKYAAQLAARIGAVFVDGEQLVAQMAKPVAPSPITPSLERAAAQDALGIVGARLRQVDCTRQGWVLAAQLKGADAKVLSQDPLLAPLRVLLLRSSEKAWTEAWKPALPDESKLLAAVNDWKDFEKEAQTILETLRGPCKVSRCLEVAEMGGVPTEVTFSNIAEFVERPLPRPPC